MSLVSVERGESWIVADSPHSGTAYPGDFDYACPLADLRSAEDTHVEKLWNFAPALGAGFVQALFPRSYLDVNRDLTELDESLVEGGWPGPLAASSKRELGMGLIWQRTLSGAPVYARKLFRAEVARRIARCWEPYHEALAQEVERAASRHGASLLLDAHSMPSDAALYARLGSAWQPCDFVIGDRHGSTAPPALTAWIADFLRERGWRVEVNHPFAGQEILRRHANPHRGRHAVQIEVSRRLYMDESTFVLHRGAQAVREAFEALVRALLALPPARWT